jgi:Fe-S cluster assembly protein SufD
MTAPITQIRTAAETALLQQFEAAAPALPGLAEARRAAIRAIETGGLPHRRIEAWHYTDLRTLMRRAEAPAAPATEALEPYVPTENLATTAFVNGRLQGAISGLDGVTIVRLADALSSGHALLARIGQGFGLATDPVAQLNAAFMTDGLIVHVPAGVAVKRPLHLAFAVAGPAAASHARVLIVLEAGASLSVLETHRAAGAGHQTNTVVEVSLAKGATLEHVRVAIGGDQAQALSSLAATVDAEADLQTFNMTVGGAVSRHQVFARVHGDDAKIGARGVTLINGRQHADNTLVVEHDARGGESRELFRTVVDGEATGVFQGKIVVKPHAQKTDGRMASNALLLGEEASMNGKPELEIFADDVQCAHGATVGALDHDLLFYLMSRGIGRKEAENLMIQAFAGAAIEEVTTLRFQNVLHGLVADWLAARA